MKATTKAERELIEAVVKWYHYYSNVTAAKARSRLMVWYPRMCKAARAVLSERSAK